MKKIMVILGTRPEAIKMAPVIRQLRRHREELQIVVVATAQHRSMLDQVLQIFEIEPDQDLDIMRPHQSLTEITIRALGGLEEVMRREQPDQVLVQGDTTTAVAGGLAAYYCRIPIGHVESGLRTGEKYSPYPEEVNRRFLDVLADLCFAPTWRARLALRSEGIPESRILVTGNTVIDALLMTAAQTRPFTDPALQGIDFGGGRKTLLATSHRRENLGAPLESVCLALRDLLSARRELQLIFPVHLNPRVRRTVWSILGDLDRALLVPPASYPDFVQIMKRVDLVITDSGGVQEEAPALGKPVLVIRANTERIEGVECGTARLIGTNREGLVAAVSLLLDDPIEYARMQCAVNPYGDGHAAERIVDAMRHSLGLAAVRPAPFEGNRGS